MATSQGDEDTALSKYACDSCRSSKITCSRERNSCERCTKRGIPCIYSRVGIIRRARKRKHETQQASGAIATPRPAPGSDDGSASKILRSDGRPQSYLASDIELTEESLGGSKSPGQRGPFNALLMLNEASTATTVNNEPTVLDSARSGKTTRLSFKKHSIEWSKIFENALRDKEPLLSPAPPEVVRSLKASRPDEIQEKAWLVMYYCIILRVTDAVHLKSQLRQELWASLGNISVLMKPSDANIQAILMVIGLVPDLIDPSLCWMLSTSACRMLQALGVTHRRIDAQNREQRRLRFWQLNLVDKALAVIFGRSPIFPQRMGIEVGLPTLEQIRPSTQHRTSDGSKGYFASHLMYQKFLLSKVMADIWQCLYGEIESQDLEIESVIANLESWYEQAHKTLEATAISEKPFCNAQNAKSIDIGLRSQDFHYFYLKILLFRKSPPRRSQCITSSKELLNLLLHLSPESDEPYHPFLWQFLYSPFTAFLLLFRDILLNPGREPKDNQEALAAMENLPEFLEKMASRNPLATRLREVSRVLIGHAESALTPSGQSRAGSDGLVAESTFTSSETASSFDMDLLCNQTTDAARNPFCDLKTDDIFESLTQDFEGNGLFDWMTWLGET
ncbi:transcriptional regulator family: Fungal Specific TF [Penicillium roqueforti]|nr:transcriptional regulator family: Fungal Specific TF [Penicillium roqueforti]KAI2712802.1 transcriptional regulator family: Fungal Specific TF [Penicillium roqueforti]KAI3124719.1 transcriptional regulator family: Fungal Specific TF [Penicillium roqueforti]KAI3146065.1 transcriptional regulator family: Fungal Specific TF [Penicillium roqueforti]KAI3160597.1 transcriptional regulator family: Fungal Specific TF [Penicillium roqueforti]